MSLDARNTRQLRRILIVLLALSALCLPLMQPFTLPGLPLSDDGAIHLMRAIALDHSLRVDGEIWPRYSSGLAYGYGAPLFNYYAPLNYFPQVLLHRLGLSFVDAWKLTMMLLAFTAALGAYLLGSARGGAAGGLAMAGAYVYAPYFVFDLVTRGTTSEVAALALLPWSLWGFEQLARRKTPAAFFSAVLAYALFIPLHNITTIFGTALLALFCLVLVAESQQKRATFLRLLSAGVTAVAVTAFYWLPALAETNHVKINAVTENLAFIDVTRTLRPLGEIFAAPQTVDPAQLQTAHPIVIGWPQMIAAGIAFFALLRQRRSRLLGISLCLYFCLMILLNLEFSAALWRSIPLIGYTQFAWRTLGPASLVAAWMIGIGLYSQKSGALSRHKAAIFVFLLICGLWSIPWLYTPYIPFTANTIQDVQDFERANRQPALSSYGEYLPITNQSPLDTEALRDRFTQSDVIERLTTTSSQIEALNATWQGSSATLDLRSAADAVLRLDWLFAPGWAAMLHSPSASYRVSVKPSEPEGLVEIEIPAGEHRLSIWRERTPVQASAEILSLLTALFAGAAAGLAHLRSRSQSVPQPVSVDTGWFLTAAAAGISLLLAKGLVIDRTQNIFRAERFEQLDNHFVPNSRTAQFEDGIRLLDVTFPERLHTDQRAEIRLFWTVHPQPPLHDYSSFAHLRNTAGRIVWQSGSFQPGGRATSRWLNGFYVKESIPVVLPALIPPGIYAMEIGLYDPTSLAPLNVLNETGNPIAPRLPLGTMIVERSPEQSRLSVSTVLATHEGLTLRALDGLHDGQQSGDELLIDWMWSAETAVERNWRVALVWLDAGGAVRGKTLPLEITPGFETSAWRAGDVWIGAQRSYIPGDLASGTLELALDWHTGDSEPVARTSLGMLHQITAPERIFTPPPVQFSSGATWQNGLSLFGYSIEDSVSRLTLVWTTNAPIRDSLRLFVHLLDGDRIADQSDGIPVSWQRPTTGWAVGEFILTEHRFTADPGEYRIRIGWYDPDTGMRIPLLGGEDASDLEQRLIIP